MVTTKSFINKKGIFLFKSMYGGCFMSKLVTISLNEEYNRRFGLIAKNEYSDKSKLVRKWIDENFREDYETNAAK